MTSLIFTLSIAALFAFILLTEERSSGAKIGIANFGLWKWMITGNWPAKVGGLLLILGVGALLRYALINLDFPPQHKLASGFFMSLLLAGVSASLKNKPDRRAIQLAFAGAAFGVAYLTAYSAYGFFNYISDVSALSLLAIVATGAAFFALSRNAMSIGILAMAGAYVAPAFAIGNPDPLSVFGYYIAVSLVTSFMVSFRGWRSLIHLSFLFTLAGAMFFGWTCKFYQPEYFQQMQPLLLGLVLIHVFMPIIEQSHTQSTWIIRFDLGYFILLPLVSLCLTLQISPDMHSDGSIGLFGLGAIWLAAALYLIIFKRVGVFRHCVVAVLFIFGAILCRLTDIPWDLVGIAVSVALFVCATRLKFSKSTEEVLCGIILLLGLVHVSNSIVKLSSDHVFLNSLFGNRILAAALLGMAGEVARRRKIGLSGLLSIAAVGWAGLAILHELVRLNIEMLPQWIFGSLLMATLLLAFVIPKIAVRAGWVNLLTLAILVTGTWASLRADADCSLAFLIFVPVVVLIFVWRVGRRTLDNKRDQAVSFVLIVFPLLIVSWAIRANIDFKIDTEFFCGTVVVLAMFVAAYWAKLCIQPSSIWASTVRTFHFRAVAVALILVTLLYIQRGPWPICFELLALGFLLLSIYNSSKFESLFPAARGAVTVFCAALVLQAMLLRGFGPDSAYLTVADVSKMNLPGMVSLMWAIFGAGIAWWATQARSRVMWTAGALLLVLAAVKLVLFDFGSLGQLGNIFAMIAAGLVFMGVAWFAPVPPAVSKTGIESNALPPSMATQSDASTQFDLSAQEIEAPDQEVFIASAKQTQDVELDAALSKGEILTQTKGPFSVASEWVVWVILLMAALGIYGLITKHGHSTVQIRQAGLGDVVSDQSTAQSNAENAATVATTYPPNNRPQLWIKLGDPESGASLDYLSINLNEMYPTMVLRQESKEIKFFDNVGYKSMQYHAEVHCEDGIYKSLIVDFLDEAGNAVLTVDRNRVIQVIGNTSSIDYPIGMFKSLCVWRDQGVAVPDISINGNWNPMDSPTPSPKLFEDLSQRFVKNNMIQFKQKAVFDPAVTVFGKPSFNAISVSFFDCANATSHSTVVVRYDFVGNPIVGTLYNDSPDTPKLETNKKRLLAACSNSQPIANFQNPQKLGDQLPLEQQQSTIQNKPKLNIIDACSAFKSRLPGTFQLLAGGDHDGKQARGNFYSREYMMSLGSGASIEPQSQYEVTVSKPGLNVVLALSSFMPSKWNIHSISGTKIVGIIFSGHHHQVLVNPPAQIPVLYSSFDDKEPCKAFYIERGQDMQKTDDVIQSIFGRSADAYYLATNGVLDMVN